MPWQWVSRLARRVTLLQTFLVLSALVLTFMAVLLGGRVQGVVEENALKQETAVTIAQAEALQHANLLPTDLAGPLTPDAKRRLATYTRQSMASGLFVRVKIWNLNGTIVYSDAPAIIGQRLAIGDDLERVLNGETPANADISDLTSAENASERGQFRHLLEVYVPIRVPAGAGSRIIGAYELYHDLRLLDRQEADLRQAIWSSVAIGFLALYVTLFIVVQNASRRLVRQSARLAHQALHDALTDLPNRALLHERLQQALRDAQRGQEATALLLMDLDRFKEINDTFGHQYGDQVLQQVGRRLREHVRAEDTVARLGGDEFAVLLPLTDAPGATRIAEAILSTLERPFSLDGYNMSVEASIGIAVAPAHGQDAITLLRRADVAMYAAKQATGGAALYAPEQDHYSPARLSLVGELRQAIDQGQLLLHYQPKLSVKTGQLDGVEALVRWHHPVRGLLPPDQFIPLAEHTGLITPLTHWVVQEAARQCRAWLDDGLSIHVAVNLSARLLHDARLAQTIATLLAAQDVRPEWLEIEITESAMMVDPARAQAVLSHLHQMGMRLAIDDFGTGHSSLAYVMRLPVDAIKIDKSFVLTMAGGREGATIARSIIDLGHNLGLAVVAEGVENQATWNQLAALGCDLVQGYHLSRPLPAAELTRWARSLAVPAEAGRAMETAR
ncbi:MAG TPA: EAL domain-containing protein [Chloroflexota bacterium]|nr:EAL domain-containing protein [Chloroflexota bacterium]